MGLTAREGCESRLCEEHDDRGVEACCAAFPELFLPLCHDTTIGQTHNSPRRREPWQGGLNARAGPGPAAHAYCGVSGARGSPRREGQVRASSAIPADQVRSVESTTLDGDSVTSAAQGVKGGRQLSVDNPGRADIPVDIP